MNTEYGIGLTCGALGTALAGLVSRKACDKMLNPGVDRRMSIICRDAAACLVATYVAEATIQQSPFTKGIGHGAKVVQTAFAFITGYEYERECAKHFPNGERITNSPKYTSDAIASTLYTIPLAVWFNIFSPGPLAEMKPFALLSAVACGMQTALQPYRNQML